MIQLPVECLKTPNAEDTRWAPPLPGPTEQPEDPWSPSESRIADRPDGISTKAVVASLVMLGALGAGSFLLMHSFVFGDSVSVAAVSGALPAQPSMIPPPPAPPSPPSFLESPTANLTPIQPVPSAPPAMVTRLPTVPANLTSIQPVPSAPPSTASMATSFPKVLPHVHVYPFPVFGAQGTTPVRGGPSANPSLAASLPPKELSDTNPYDDVPDAKTNAAPRALLHADGVPSDHPVVSRE
jgi:hypothetical protein